MTLNEFAAARKRSIFEELLRGAAPSEGRYDERLLAEGRVKGRPQMGTTVYHPDRLSFEFIYADPQSAPTVLSVEIDAPERIVFLPVPAWVVETIWQGEIAGSFHFESDARRLIEAFGCEMEPDRNAKHFERAAPTRRE